MTGKSRKMASVPKVDTRGLPFGFDPRMFYEYSSQNRRQSATGLEGFLYKLMPYNLIRSLAFAIDPLSNFKVSATRISPVVRTRTKLLSSVLSPRSWTYHKYVGQEPYKYNMAGFYQHDTYEAVQPAQLHTVDRSEDITKSDRPSGSDMGEFSSWKAQTSSPPRGVRFHEDQKVWYNDYPSGYYYILWKHYSYTDNGPAAYISRSDVDAIQGEVQGRALAAMQANVLSMYRATTAQKQATTLFRNIVELRDIPRSIIQLRDTLLKLRALSEALKIPNHVLELIHSFKTTGLRIPKEYLSYQFGWRQTYSDLRDLLLAPERISKRVNFLIRRNGKATTYRSQRVISENYATTSGFSYSVYPSETVIGTSHSVSIEHVLKMVINTTFEFPDVDTPYFRSKEFYRQLGVVPSPIDLYNLVPWTWMIDWFTGFGKYLEVIQSINEDRELINWGLLSCISKGELSTTLSTKVQNADTTNGGTVFSYPVYSHTSRLMFHSHLRKDVSGLLNVKTTGDMSTLSSYQLSILGSILSGRLKF